LGTSEYKSYEGGEWVLAMSREKGGGVGALTKEKAGVKRRQNVHGGKPRQGEVREQLKRGVWSAGNAGEGGGGKRSSKKEMILLVRYKQPPLSGGLGLLPNPKST